MAITGAFDTDGGIAAVNRLVIQAILDEGYKIDIFAFTEKDKEISQKYTDPSKINYKVYSGNKLFFIASVWQALLNNKYDFVFSDHVNVSCILLPFSKVGFCHYIVWLHGIEVFPPKPDIKGKLGLQSAWKRLASSDYTQKRVTERFPGLQVTACDLALDPFHYPQSLPPTPTQTVLPIEMECIGGAKHLIGTRLILHVGRMSTKERYKGQESLLQAFPLLHKQFPDVQLLLAGRGDDLPRIRSLADPFPEELRNAIFIPGYVDDAMLEQLYRTCYLFAMPSQGEGFGLVYLEAMAHAKPCVGNRFDAASSVIRDRVTGVLVDDPKSTEQVAAAISWLISHPEESHRMGMVGYDLVRSQYLFRHFRKRFWKAISY